MGVGMWVAGGIWRWGWMGVGMVLGRGEGCEKGLGGRVRGRGGRGRGVWHGGDGPRAKEIPLTSAHEG